MIPRPLEVELHELLSQKANQRFLLAVSGGLDSMALFYSFWEMSKKFPLEFSVAHIHHGSATPEQISFRDGARDFVKKKCAQKNIKFHTNSFDPELAPLRSEQQLRQFRLQELGKIKKAVQADYVVFSHHAEDLLETRLIRLLRGTGPEGIVAMLPERGAVLRPFLSHSKGDLKAYLELVKGEWMEDPSNLEIGYLRNWLRHKWLPALEKKRAGSSSALARSLQSLADLTQATANFEGYFEDERLLRTEFLLLGPADKRRVLGVYLKSQNCTDFGLSHINELIKRLDVEQKDLTFRVAKKNWRANAKHIWCEA